VLNINGDFRFDASERIVIDYGGVFQCATTGGTVAASQIDIRSGGKLSAACAIVADVSNAGAIEPESFGGLTETMSITGDFTQSASGRLEMHLSAIDGTSDRLNISGAAILDGSVNIRSDGGIPLPGNVYPILSFGSAAGELELVNHTGLDGLRFAQVQTATSLSVSLSAFEGDANLDAIVDIGDFSLLASNFNLPGNWLAGNFNGDGLVDIGDFALLAGNFNQTTPAVVSRNVVPEPLFLGVAATLAVITRRRR
jgi:hypothetical protein